MYVKRINWGWLW